MNRRRAGARLATIRNLKWLLTAGNPTPSCKAATLLYLHGVRATAATRLKVKDLEFSSTPARVTLKGTRTVYLTDELSNILRDLAKGKREDETTLGYGSFSEFHNDFRKAARVSKLVNFDLSDIQGAVQDSRG
jgi:integrase